MAIQTSNPMPLPFQQEAERARYEAHHKANGGYGRGNYKPLLRHIVEGAGKTGGVVVDLGCGRALLRGWLARFHPAIRYIGVDFAGGWADVKRPLHDTGLPSATADLLLSVDVMEHLIPEEVPAVMAELARIAKPGARVLFYISERESRHTSPDGRNMHLTVKPSEWWCERMNEAGFKVAVKVIVGMRMVYGHRA